MCGQILASRRSKEEQKERARRRSWKPSLTSWRSGLVRVFGVGDESGVISSKLTEAVPTLDEIPPGVAAIR